MTSITIAHPDELHESVLHVTYLGADFDVTLPVTTCFEDPCTGLATFAVTSDPLEAAGPNDLHLLCTVHALRHHPDAAVLLP